MQGLTRKKLVMIIIVFCCLIAGLQIVASNGSSVCMVDCTSLLTPHPPSSYEQYCCIPSNSGKKFNVKEKNRVKIILCPSTIPTSCSKYMYDSCYALLQAFPVATSGYYSLTLSNGSIITVYCDMEGSNCDDKGGWMRVGYLNMSEPNALCSPGLYTYNFNSTDHPLCDRFNSSSGSCNSTFFSTRGISYQHICGQVRGYQYRIADGIYPNDDNSNDSIDGYYVDGVSITHGSNPRKHIWTYICGQFEEGTNYQNCPCNNGSEATLPSYVGNEYYCESAGPTNGWPNDVFTDILWDGQNCPGIEATCCTSPKMPWFLKTLTNLITDNIEVRLCTSQGYPDEATPIDIIELFVR